MAKRKHKSSSPKGPASAPVPPAGAVGAGAGPLAVAAVALLFVLFLAHAYAFQFTQDDAYISFRYAQNLVRGQGLVFNPGERVEGYSNFLWTILLALAIQARLPLVLTSRILGVLLGLGVIWMTIRFTRSIGGREGVVPLLAGAIVAGNSAFAYWSTGGLETALFAFLITAGLYSGLAPDVSPRGRVFAPFLLGLACLTRPDAPVILVTWFGIRVLDSIRGGPARQRGDGVGTLVRDVAIVVLLLAPWVIWKLAYYGELLPNTYYAKAGVSTEYWARGVEYARDFFGAYGLWGVTIALALLSLGKAGVRGVEAGLLVVWLAYGLYVLSVGGDVLQGHRFWLATLPIGAILVAQGASWLGETLAVRSGSTPGRGQALATLLVLGAVGLTLWRNWEPLQRIRSDEVRFVRTMGVTGSWLGRNLPRDATLATTTIGAVSYESGLRVIDMLGLTDPDIARSPEFIPGLTDTWREIKYNAESVLARKPDAILFSTGLRPSSAAEKALFAYRGFHDAYYPHYFRTRPTDERRSVIYRRKPDAESVSLERVDGRGIAFIDEYGEGHLALGIRNDNAEAADHFRSALEGADGDFPWAREYLGAALYYEGAPEGLALLSQIAAQDRYSVTAHHIVAGEALGAGRLEEAASLYEEVLTYDPDLGETWFSLAELTRQRGDVAHAFGLAREGVERWEASAPHLTFFGDLALQVDSLDAATWGFRRALTLEPTDAAARQGLARAREARGVP